MSDWLMFFGAYAIVLLVVRMLNAKEFRRNPEKAARYRVLPLGYKLLCWLLVIPLFAGAIIKPVLGLLALVAFMFLESACVRWYRRAGLW